MLLYYCGLHLLRIKNLAGQIKNICAPIKQRRINPVHASRNLATQTLVFRTRVTSLWCTSAASTSLRWAEWCADLGFSVICIVFHVIMGMPSIYQSAHSARIKTPPRISKMPSTSVRLRGAFESMPRQNCNCGTWISAGNYYCSRSPSGI